MSSNEPQSIQDAEILSYEKVEDGSKNQNEGIIAKIVLLGDDGVGKTVLASTYKDGEVPKGDVPVIIPNFGKIEKVDNKQVQLVLWDSACNSEYDEIRRKSYPDTKIFLMCFSLNNPKSLAHLRTIWMKEIEKYTESAIVVLVGTKMDVRTMAEKDIDPIRRMIAPRLYLEVSSKTNNGVMELFQTIASGIIDPDSLLPIPSSEEVRKNYYNQSQCCLLL